MPAETLYEADELYHPAQLFAYVVAAPGDSNSSVVVVKVGDALGLVVQVEYEQAIINSAKNLAMPL